MTRDQSAAFALRAIYGPMASAIDPGIVIGAMLGWFIGKRN
jgi:F0F1-type ATP synthase assembly protein I